MSKIIIYSASKWLEKDLSIKKIDINYFSEVIELNVVKIKNNKNFSYENIFEAEKIIIKYNLNTILKDLVQIDYLTIHISSGLEALKASKKVSGKIKLIGVTILTSLDNKALKEFVFIFLCSTI